MINTLLKRRMENTKKNKKGFTLVELIVVLVIIAILAAVLIPTVSGYIGRARKTSAQSAAKSEVTAFQAAATDVLGANSTLTDKGSEIATNAATYGATMTSSVATGATGVTAATDKCVESVKFSTDGAVTGLWYKEGNYRVYFDGSTYTAQKDSYSTALPASPGIAISDN